MTSTLTAILLAVLVLSTSIWVGGYLAIIVVARASTRTLDSATRVAFFRDLGRRYFWVGTPALVIALVTGGVLARDVARGPLLVATAALAALLVVSFAIAVAQARRMTRLRLQLTDSPEDPALQEQVRSGALRAGGLRGLLGVLSLLLVVLGSFLAT